MLTGTQNVFYHHPAASHRFFCLRRWCLILFITFIQILAINRGFVGVGALTALIGYLRFRRIEKQLLNDAFYPQWRLLMIFTAGLNIAGLFLLVYLLPNL